MVALFYTVIFLIAYGSLYPFDFSLSALSGAATERFIFEWSLFTGRGDQIGNVALFLPYGFFGMLALKANRSQFANFLALAIFGFILAAWLQVLQLMLPSRDAALGDVFWNMLGTVVGAAAAVQPRVRAALERQTALSAELVPLALAGCWLAAELAPFVPSVDFQAFKDSIRPLWQSPTFDFPDFLRAAVAWMVLAWLATPHLRKGQLPLVLGLAMAGMAAAKIVIVDNVLTLTDVAALAAAYGGAQFLTGFGERQARILLWLFAASIAISSFAPYNLTSTQTFHWIPFSGSLSGSMLINAKVIAGKLFTIGSIYFLALRSGVPVARATGPVVAAFLVIEIGQLWVGGHTAEITDPILALAAASAFSILARHDAATRHRHTAAAAASPQRAEPVKAPEKPADRSRTTPLDHELLLPDRRGAAVLFLACAIIALAMHKILGLPTIPYNVRELFGGSDSWWRLFFFAAAVFSFGIGGTIAGHRTARSGAPWTSLPVTSILACIATYVLLSICVTSESIDDIAGSTNTWYYVTERNIWGEIGAWLFLTVGWEGLVAPIERIVRFTALLSPFFLWIAVVTGVYFRTTDTALTSGSARTRALIGCTAGYVLCALPWLYVFRLIAFTHSSTDNLNELIGDKGFWLYPLLILLPLNMVLIAHATIAPRIRNLLPALLVFAVSLPVGWFLFRSGLSAPVEKYGLRFTGADFLLGPDRRELLPRAILMIRWFALQTVAIAVLAFGMRILLARRPRAIDGNV